MKKHSLIVIIIAGILALLGAFAVFKLTQKSEMIKPVKEEEIIPVPEPEPIKIEEAKPEPVKNPVKKVSYKKPAPKPQKAEAPKFESIVVKEAEPVQNEGVIQEDDSKDIVITQEYKIPTRARYTFK